MFSCVRMGSGFGDFLDLRENVFFLRVMPGSGLPLAGRVT
jgi:hypothetical protein